MEAPGYKYEQKYRKTGLTVSLIMHIIVFLSLFYPIINQSSKTTENPGILVVFGEENVGNGPFNEALGDPTQLNNLQQVNETSKPLLTEKSTGLEKNKVITSKISDPNEKKVTATSQNIENPVSNNNRQEISEAKKSYGSLFGAKSRGNAGTDGFQGDPLGSRDSKIMEGRSTGTGTFGNGLGSREILYEPKFQDQSQKSGTVVITICINSQGNVISSNYTQKGSTTSDSHLIEVAETNAKRYKFAPSEKAEQCGTVSIRFIVK